MAYSKVDWFEIYPFAIDLGLINLREVPFLDRSWDLIFNDSSFKYHVDWGNQKLRFKTEEDKVEFILRWL